MEKSAIAKFLAECGDLKDFVGKMNQKVTFYIVKTCLNLSFVCTYTYCFRTVPAGVFIKMITLYFIT